VTSNGWIAKSGCARRRAVLRSRLIAVIETERLLLRDLELADLGALVRLWADDDVARFMDDFGPRSRDEVEAWVPEAISARHAEPNFRSWVIVSRGTGAVVGWISFGPSSPGVGDLDFAYIVDRDHRGPGYAAEALRASVQYCFNELGVTSFWGECHPDNAASAAAMLSAGLQFIGTVDGQDRYRVARS